MERALEDARSIGFEAVSVSGGEPFLYPELGRLLATAKRLGMQTAVTSNGTAITKRRLAGVIDHLDAIAVSVDGPPARHNSIRGSERAFDRLVQGIERLREAGVPFGVIHTLTADQWSDLPWLAEFAVEHGARLLQIHPLEPAGRARFELGDAVPRAATNERAYLLARAIEARHADTLAVQLDLLLRRDILAMPHIVHAGPDVEAEDDDGPKLDSLVLEEDATVVPLSYGFSRRYAVGDLRSQSLGKAFAYWGRSRWPEFQALSRVLLERVRKDQDRLVNWHERMVELSHQAAVGMSTYIPDRGERPTDHIRHA